MIRTYPKTLFQKLYRFSLNNYQKFYFRRRGRIKIGKRNMLLAQEGLSQLVNTFTLFLTTSSYSLFLSASKNESLIIDIALGSHISRLL